MITANSLYSNFIDAADDSGSIKNNRDNLEYCAQLAAGIIRYDLYNELSVGAVYPMIGGTATSHKFNFMNPVDSNAAFRLSFIGGWSHSATGALPDGSTGYANTFYIPYNHLTVDNAHLSYYSRSNSTGAGYPVEFGAVRDLTGSVQTANYQMDLALKYYQDENHQTNIGLTSTRINTPLNLSTIGHFLSQRTAFNSLESYKNGNLIAQSIVSNSGGALPTNSLYLCAKLPPSGAIAQFSNRECAFASIGTSLTKIKIEKFSHLVYALQGIKSRQ